MCLRSPRLTRRSRRINLSSNQHTPHSSPSRSSPPRGRALRSHIFILAADLRIVCALANIVCSLWRARGSACGASCLLWLCNDSRSVAHSHRWLSRPQDPRHTHTHTARAGDGTNDPFAHHCHGRLNLAIFTGQEWRLMCALSGCILWCTHRARIDESMTRAGAKDESTQPLAYPLAALPRPPNRAFRDIYDARAKPHKRRCARSRCVMRAAVLVYGGAHSPSRSLRNDSDEVSNTRTLSSLKLWSRARAWSAYCGQCSYLDARAHSRAIIINYPTIFARAQRMVRHAHARSIQITIVHRLTRRRRKQMAPLLCVRARITADGNLFIWCTLAGPSATSAAKRSNQYNNQCVVDVVALLQMQ